MLKPSLESITQLNELKCSSIGNMLLSSIDGHGNSTMNNPGVRTSESDSIIVDSTVSSSLVDKQHSVNPNKRLETYSIDKSGQRLSRRSVSNEASKKSVVSHGYELHSSRFIEDISPTVLCYNEMSPETSLIEFISTSASYHGIRQTTIQNLESDILMVFPNHLMPANAAAWYMAKRRFYLYGNNCRKSLNLLSILLTNYPRKFTVTGNRVEFLESYSRDVAETKLSGLVIQGLLAYFNHKIEEYGIYFFDPYYYESTEPFLSNLIHATKPPENLPLDKLVGRYFRNNRTSFNFKLLSPYLVAISRPSIKTKIKVNCTCVITSVVNDGTCTKYGVLKFVNLNSKGKPMTEKAIFPLRVLFKDGFVFCGDPLKLPAMEFDGYKIPMNKKGVKGERNKMMIEELTECCWFGVLVWCGAKPSPRFCATKDDIIGSSSYLNYTIDPKLIASKMGAPSRTSNHFHYPLKSVNIDKEEEVSAFSLPQKQPLLSDNMIIGQVIKMRKDGAIISPIVDSIKPMQKKQIGSKLKSTSKVEIEEGRSIQSVKKNDSLILGDDEINLYFIPGWIHGNNGENKWKYLTTTEGVELAPFDVIAFYAVNKQAQLKMKQNKSKESKLAHPTNVQTIGCNVVLIRHNNHQVKENVISLEKTRKGSNKSMKQRSAKKRKSSKRSKYSEAYDVMKRASFLLTDEFEDEHSSDGSFDPADVYDPIDNVDLDHYSDGSISEGELQSLLTDLNVSDAEIESLRKDLDEFHSKRMDNEAVKEDEEEEDKVSKLANRVEKLIESVKSNNLPGECAPTQDSAKDSKL